MPMMKKYASYADWKKDQSAKNKRLIGALEQVVKKAAPHLERTVKWGQGCFTEGDVPKAFIHAEPDYVQFGFYLGSSLDDPAGRLVGKGKYVRHVPIRTASDIDARVLGKLLLQATGKS